MKGKGRKRQEKKNSSSSEPLFLSESSVAKCEMNPQKKYSLVLCGNCEIYFINNKEFEKHWKLCSTCPVCRKCKNVFGTLQQLRDHIKVTNHKVKKKSYKKWVKVPLAEYSELIKNGRVYINACKYIKDKMLLIKKQNAELNTKRNTTVSQMPLLSLKVESEPSGQEKTRKIWSDICGNAPSVGMTDIVQKATESGIFNSVLADSLSWLPGVLERLNNNKEVKSLDNSSEKISDATRSILNNLNMGDICRPGNDCFSLYICKLCNAYFIYLGEYKKHKFSCKERNTCLVCSSKFNNRQNLLKHIYSMKHARMFDIYSVNVYYKEFEQLIEKQKIIDISKCMKKDRPLDNVELNQNKITTLLNKENVEDEEQPKRNVTDKCINLMKVEVTEENPASPSDSGCQFDDDMSLDGVPSDECDIEQKLVINDLPVNLPALDGISLTGKENDNKDVMDKKREAYRPLPISVKISKLECNHACLSEYLRIQQHPERQMKCIKLQTRTETCPGCMESIDARSAVFNLETFKVSMWCKNCEWDIVFTDFFHA